MVTLTIEARGSAKPFSEERIKVRQILKSAIKADLHDFFGTGAQIVCGNPHPGLIDGHCGRNPMDLFDGCIQMLWRSSCLAGEGQGPSGQDLGLSDMAEGILKPFRAAIRLSGCRCVLQLTKEFEEKDFDLKLGSSTAVQPAYPASQP